MMAIASQITSLTIVYSAVYSGAHQRKHQSSASLAFVWGIHRGPVNSPHKWPVTRKMFPFDDVIMEGWFITDHDITSWLRNNSNWVGMRPLDRGNFETKIYFLYIAAYMIDWTMIVFHVYVAQIKLLHNTFKNVVCKMAAIFRASIC